MPRGATPGRNLGKEVAADYAGAWGWALCPVDPAGYSGSGPAKTYSRSQGNHNSEATFRKITVWVNRISTVPGSAGRGRSGLHYRSPAGW
jgi:hypothetical protein